MKKETVKTPPNPAKTVMQSVKLSDIVIGDSNPRKDFDKDDIAELSASIKNQGVLQPILLRPKGKKYELVCGERRMRASKAAGLIEIPANIRTLTDDEALECQITENLMRKDVHPMEEANAFQDLITRKKWKIEELANRIGKSATYIAGRLKLNDLIPAFQKAFFKERMSLSDALRVSRIHKNSQAEMWEEDFSNDEEIEIDSHYLKSYQGDLSDAPFDTKDPGLNKTMGSCGSCPFNSASNTLLFPEGGKAICTNISCFSGKAKASFDQQLKAALNDPSVILVSDNWQFEAKAKELISKGHTVLIKRSLTILEAPEAPEMADFESNLKVGVFDTKKEMMEDFKSAKEDYEKELKAYEKEKTAGKLTRAFVVEGDDAGKYWLVKKKSEPAPGAKATTAGAVKEKIAEGKATKADIEGEIKRIEERLKRSNEIEDGEVRDKVFDLICENEDEFFAFNINKMTGLQAAIVILSNECQMYTDEFQKAIGFDGSDEDMWAHLSTMTDKQLVDAIVSISRFVVVDSFAISQDHEYHVIEAMAKEFKGDDVQALHAEQSNNAVDRKLKADKRIEAMKKELPEQKKGKGLAALLPEAKK